MTTLTGPQPKQSIVVKSQVSDREVVLDLSDTVLDPLTIASASINAVAFPATVPPLVTTVLSVLNQTVTLLFSGGLDNTSYGVGLLITDSLTATYSQTVAVVVKDDLVIRYQETNPYAFQSLVDSIDVGGAAVGKAFFMMPAGVNASGGYVTWSLLDKQGLVYSKGNAYDYNLTVTSTYTAIEAHAVVNTPSDIEPSNLTDRYQLRWELNIDGSVNQYAFENLRVDSTFSIPTGAQDSVEMFGDLASIEIVLPQAWDTVTVDVYTSVGSTLVASSLPIVQRYRVSSGWFYQAELDTSLLTASLDPYIVSWKFKNATGPSYRDTGQVFVVNASIMRAVKSVESMISKAKTSLMGFPDELFTVPIIVTMLGRGRDAFNGAYGMFTQFTMTNADAFIREYWIKYSEVALLESQYLLEGEKAYNFSGQAISLEVDRTTYYQGLAQEIKTAIDAEIKAIKQNLIKKGLTSGDGSLVGLGRYGSLGPVGISISPASNFGGFRGFVSR